MPTVGHVLLRDYTPSGRYGARQMEDILFATTSHEGGEGS